MVRYFYLAPEYTVEIVRRLVELIPEPRLNERHDPDRFTPREQIAHLADWEPIFQERIRGGLENDNFVITPYDESQRAISENYAGQDVREALARWSAARAQTMELVKTLSRDQLLRPITHPEHGPMNVMELVCMLSQHDLYHIEDLMHYTGEKTAGTW